MYVVTFYSFKGGTGRSMALMNVAADLLSRGRRVLVVDFDLEAPGLDTFPMTIDRPISGGLVEMIDDYLNSTSEDSPSVDQHVYKASLDGVGTGSLWIMPAGRQDSQYDSRFKSIDWKELYEEHGGYLFFEDLKAQWREAYNPDYVLIDSRTGHTDIGGICTRQLPDSVVVMFFPNEQNIRGLVPVVRDIKSEAALPLKKLIDLVFVMGNVPDLDDEDAILSGACQSAKTHLEYSELGATIHHVSTLSMLSQRLMVVDRPRSKVALEYRQLTDVIVRANLDDREGAIAVLRQELAEIRSGYEGPSDRKLEERLQYIRGHHAGDPEVLIGVARIRRAQRRSEDARELFDEILEHNPLDPECLIGRAEIFTNSNAPESALRDLGIFFELKDVSQFAFQLGARLLIRNDIGSIPRIISSPALPLLSDDAVSNLMMELQRDYNTCDFGVQLARNWRVAGTFVERNKSIGHELSLALIGAARFAEAKEEISRSGTFEQFDLAESFNFSMAEWGCSLAPPREYLERMIPKVEEASEEEDINHLQCFAMFYWALGDYVKALSFKDKAAKLYSRAPRTLFSAWSYLYLPPKLFRADLDALGAAIQGESRLPSFLRTSNRIQ